MVADVRFLGATLWTDFKLDEPKGTSVARAMLEAAIGLNDFRGAIRLLDADAKQDRWFAPMDAAEEHQLSRAWLLQRLRQTSRADSNLPTVVVTHHAPNSCSMDPRYEGSNLNPCFYSDLPEQFFQHATLWIHCKRLAVPR